MEFEQILQLIDRVSDSKVTSFHYENEGVKISLECGQPQVINTVCVDNMPQTAVQNLPVMSVSAGTISPADQGIQADALTKEPEGNLVKSPLVGTFYTAPAEDAEPFVKVGDKVKKGQVLAIVEAMKLMNDIECEFDGEVAEVYVKNGEAVEYGKPLFRII